MKSPDTASGNLLADRRADYAEMLFADGEHAAAAALMLDALELAPDWALGWFRAGEFHEAAGDLPAAELAWRMARRIDPSDRAGAALKLQWIGVISDNDPPPSAFVEALYDQYAGTFEQALVDALGYCGPDLILAAIERHGPHRFRRALDLGCGTGLMGERLRPIADHLEGHDISAAMLARARAKSVYDLLVKSDLQTLALPAGSVDLVTVADVFIYIGPLERMVAVIADALRPGGVFAFSVEECDGADYALRETRRYAHARRYLERLIADNGLVILSLDEAVIRRDRNAPVPGLIVLATRPGA